jgi:hypothetical protein
MSRLAGKGRLFNIPLKPPNAANLEMVPVRARDSRDGEPRGRKVSGGWLIYPEAR